MILLYYTQIYLYRYSPGDPPRTLKLCSWRYKRLIATINNNKYDIYIYTNIYSAAGVPAGEPGINIYEWTRKTVGTPNRIFALNCDYTVIVDSDRMIAANKRVSI